MSTIEEKARVFCLLMPLVVFSIISLSSCAYDRELEYLNDQVTALNKRVKYLEDTRGRDVASMSADVDKMQREVQRLSGRTEENENLIKQTVERDFNELDAMRTKVKDLSDRIAEMETSAKKQQEGPGLNVPTPPEKKVPEQVASKPGEAGREQPVTPEAPKNKQVEDYDKALASYKQGKYAEAIDAFRLFLKTYPKSDRADNAYFWIGECYMGLKQYEQAILAFQDVIKKYPKANKVPNALLRQAQAFLEIKDKTSAQLLYKRIIKNYPGTDEAKLAQKKLQSMK
jgi:tol-pal system protein YbgF